MLTGLPLRGNAQDEIGLAAQERRCLQHVDDGGHFVERRVLVHVGQHRHAELALDALQYPQTLFDTRPAITA